MKGTKNNREMNNLFQLVKINLPFCKCMPLWEDEGIEYETKVQTA